MLSKIIFIIILTATVYQKLNRNCETLETVWKPNLVPTYTYLQPWTNQLKKQLFNKNHKNQNQTMSVLKLALLLSGDIQQNPGPAKQNTTINPCGLCERPVTWESAQGVCCDNCSVWVHRSCVELCTEDYELLNRSSVQWLCCRCDSMNVDSFTYHSFELHTYNFFSPLSQLNLTLDSDLNSSVFEPVHTSSPKSNQNKNSTQRKSTESSKRSSKSDSKNSNIFKITSKENLRIMTINCRSVLDKKSELAACLEYTKPA